MAVQHYRDLIAWQRGMDLVEAVYRTTQQFPRDELYGLTNQVRRAAVSVPSNIAEGQGRGIGKEFCYHLRIANGSRQEFETQILVAQRLNYITSETAKEVMDLSDEFGRILSGLAKSVVVD